MGLKFKRIFKELFLHFTLYIMLLVLSIVYTITYILLLDLRTPFRDWSYHFVTFLGFYRKTYICLTPSVQQGATFTSTYIKILWNSNSVENFIIVLKKYLFGLLFVRNLHFYVFLHLHLAGLLVNQMVLSFLRPKTCWENLSDPKCSFLNFDVLILCCILSKMLHLSFWHV